MKSYLNKWPEIASIPKSEYPTYFPQHGKPWEDEEIDYIIEWWEKEDVIHFSFALGRLPFTIQDKATLLRKNGVHLPHKSNGRRVDAQDRRKQIVDAYLSGMNVRQTMKEAHATGRTVQKVLREELGDDYLKIAQTRRQEAWRLTKQRRRECD